METNKIPKLYMFNAPEGVVVQDYLTDQEFSTYLLHALQSRPNSRYLITKTIEFFDLHQAKLNNVEPTQD